MPFWAMDALDVCSREKALQIAHQPHSAQELRIGLGYFAAERILAHHISLLMRESGPGDGRVLKTDKHSAFVGLLGFSLTSSQQRAIEEISNDLASGKAMNRIVQGDVGSGKTAVAMCAVFIAASCGVQAAFLAPTEILARQHHERYLPILESLGIKSEVLTGSASAKEKAQIAKALAREEVAVVFGTHALLNASIEIPSLSLIVIDEQQRFGVAQRAAIASKGRGNAHVLSLSATPIPRTLLIALSGGMDISAIDEMPQGRIPPRTYIITQLMEQRVYRFIAERIKAG